MFTITIRGSILSVFFPTLAYAKSLKSKSAKAFRIGFMLEQAHYLAEAYTYYKKATTLDPGVPVYKSTLESFKKDYSLK